MFGNNVRLIEFRRAIEADSNSGLSASSVLTFSAEGKMAAERSYDAIVIGAGQGGKPLSMVLARAGLKTAVVEERYVGGTCVNYG
jgi:alkyl hydroperoxide reductase subunit AhpF